MTTVSAGRGRDVLVVEDESRMAGLLSRAPGAAGFRPSVELSCLGGLQRVRGGDYSLLLLDLTLPDVDGVAVLTGAREARPDLPVLILSALSDVRSKVMCLELGASDYMTKPFDLAELIARVRLHTRGHAARHEQSRLQAGDLCLDLQRRVVETPRGEVSLTTREFVLLEYLVRHEGHVCTREELRENVWGTRFDPGTNVVDVCVARLRQKLGGHPIETVRNVGYAYMGT